MIGVASAARDEEGVVGVEHLFRQHLEPLSGQPSGILALLSPDIYFYPSFECLGGCLHNLSKTVFKNLLSSHMQVHHVVFGLLPESFEFCLEDHMFVVEGEHVGSGYCDLEDGYLGYTHVSTYIYFWWIGQFFLDAIVDVGFKDGMADALPPQFRQIKLSQHNLFLPLQFRRFVLEDQFTQRCYLVMFLLFVFLGVLIGRGGYGYFKEDKETLEDFSHGRLDVGIGRFEEIVWRGFTQLLQGVDLYYFPQLGQTLGMVFFVSG